MPSESAHTTDAPPGATSVPQDDAAALRVLLLRQRDLFPAMRRDDCPPQIIDEYLRTSGLIVHCRARLGDVRYHAIKAEVTR